MATTQNQKNTEVEQSFDDKFKNLQVSIKNISSYHNAVESLIDLFVKRIHSSDSMMLSKKNLFESFFTDFIYEANKIGDVWNDIKGYILSKDNAEVILDRLYKLFSLEKDPFYGHIIDKISNNPDTVYGYYSTNLEKSYNENDSASEKREPRDLVYRDSPKSCNYKWDHEKRTPSKWFFADIALQEKTETVTIGDFIDGKYKLPDYNDDNNIDTTGIDNQIGKIASILRILDTNVWKNLNNAVNWFDLSFGFSGPYTLIKLQYHLLFSKAKSIRDLYDVLNNIFNDTNLSNNEAMVYYYRCLSFIQKEWSELIGYEKAEKLFKTYYEQYFHLLEQSNYKDTQLYRESLAVKKIIEDQKGNLLTTTPLLHDLDKEFFKLEPKIPTLQSESKKYRELPSYLYNLIKRLSTFEETVKNVIWDIQGKG